MEHHKCFEVAEDALDMNIEDTFAILSSISNGKFSGYGLRILRDVYTKNGKVRREKSFIKMSFCPLCGKSLISD